MIFEKQQIVHGIVNSYNKGGCRCDLCKKAKSDYRRNAPITKHGTKWNYDKGCRCSFCREAKNLAKRKQYGRQPRKVTTNVKEGTRICYICHETKFLEEFTKNSNKRVFLGRGNECKSCQRKRGKITRQTSPIQRFSAYRYGAKMRNIPFNLSFEQFMTFWCKPCYYCGDPIEGIGLDRKDSKGSYSIDNVISCCSGCNYAKKSKTSDGFISMCIKVAERFKNHIVLPIV
jgi:hypothetical protein